jgi:hypothetical protein
MRTKQSENTFWKRDFELNISQNEAVCNFRGFDDL